MAEKWTVGVVKGDIGAIGHNHVHREVLEALEEELAKKAKGLLADYFVIHFGDDVGWVFSTDLHPDEPKLHQCFMDIFWTVGERFEYMTYATLQDFKERVEGVLNVSGMGPAIAALHWTPVHPGETVAVMGMDKTQPGSFNVPIMRMYADPWHTTLGLTNDKNMRHGYTFEVWDTIDHKVSFFKMPEDLYKALTFLAHPYRYCIKRVYANPGNRLRRPDEAICCVSTEKVFEVKGEYAGKDDPVAITLLHSGAPPTGCLANAFFNEPLFGAGWMNGSCYSPVCPTPMEETMCSINDGPIPLVILGFTVADDLTLHGFDGNGKYYDLCKHPAAKLAAERAINLAHEMLSFGFIQPTLAEREIQEKTFREAVFRELEEEVEWKPLPKMPSLAGVPEKV